MDINLKSKPKVYIIQCSEYFKIGVSVNPTGRMSYILGTPEVIIPFRGMLIAELVTENARQLEALIHKEFKEFCCVGEWFLLDNKVLNFVINKYKFTLKNEPIFKIDNCSVEIHAKILAQRLEYEIMKCNETKLNYEEMIAEQKAIREAIFFKLK
jgi:Meiotically up-regulated gene 113